MQLHTVLSGCLSLTVSGRIDVPTARMVLHKCAIPHIPQVSHRRIMLHKQAVDTIEAIEAIVSPFMQFHRPRAVPRHTLCHAENIPHMASIPQPTTKPLQ